MKKALILCMLLVSAIAISAGERGKFIHVDNTTAQNLKPQLAFYQERVDAQDVTSLLLQTINVNDYYEFSDASRLLIRFADGTTARLQRIAGSDIQKEKFNKKNGRATITYFKTITRYEVTPEVLEKIQEKVAIIKLRVVFKENDAKDYEITESYQPRMAEGLHQSYSEARQKNRQSTTDLSDEDF